MVAVDSLDSESGSGSNSEGTPSTKSHEGESENGKLVTLVGFLLISYIFIYM